MYNDKRERERERERKGDQHYLRQEGQVYVTENGLVGVGILATCALSSFCLFLLYIA
jgi:hypothetical protein